MNLACGAWQRKYADLNGQAINALVTVESTRYKTSFSQPSLRCSGPIRQVEPSQSACSVATYNALPHGRAAFFARETCPLESTIVSSHGLFVLFVQASRLATPKNFNSFGVDMV